MSLSKVYRGEDAGELKEFQFRSFGDTASVAPAEGEGFTAPGAVETAAPKSAPPVEPKPDLSLAKQVEEAYARGRQEGLSMAEQRFESATMALTQALEDVTRLR